MTDGDKVSFAGVFRHSPGRLVAIFAGVQMVLWAGLATWFADVVPYDTAEGFVWGRSLQWGYHKHPPLQAWILGVSERLFPGAFWLAFVYGQLCIGIATWAVWQLARSIVGDQQGALAALALAGVHTFTLPNATFTPDQLSIPIWALLCLHFWRAVGEGRPLYWYALAIDVALVVYSKYVGLLLVLVLAVLTLATSHGRATLRSPHPWISALLALLLASPHLLFLAQDPAPLLSYPLDREQAGSSAEHIEFVSRFIGAQVLNHLGLAFLASFLFLRTNGGGGLVVPRTEPPPFSKPFVYTVALAPVTITVLLNVWSGVNFRHAWTLPMFCLSPLAVILLAGDKLRIARPHLAATLLILLAIGQPIASFAVRTVQVHLGRYDQMTYPARELAHTVTAAFRERTGLPLRTIVGRRTDGGLAALYSPDRPLVFLDADPRQSPWIDTAALTAGGFVVIWPLPPSGTELESRAEALVRGLPRTQTLRLKAGKHVFDVAYTVVPPTVAGRSD